MVLMTVAVPDGLGPWYYLRLVTAVASGRPHPNRHRCTKQEHEHEREAKPWVGLGRHLAGASKANDQLSRTAYYSLLVRRAGCTTYYSLSVPRDGIIDTVGIVEVIDSVGSVASALRASVFPRRRSQ